MIKVIASSKWSLDLVKRNVNAARSVRVGASQVKMLVKIAGKRSTRTERKRLSENRRFRKLARNEMMISKGRCTNRQKLNIKVLTIFNNTKQQNYGTNNH